MNEVEALLRSKGYRLIEGQWFAPSRLAPASGSQPDLGVEPLAAPARKIANPVRRSVRITSYRCRLVDRDAIWIKYAIDALRYAGILFDDTEKWLLLKTEQVKVAELRQERTEITIL